MSQLRADQIQLLIATDPELRRITKEIEQIASKYWHPIFMSRGDKLKTRKLMDEYEKWLTEHYPNHI